MEGGAPGDVIRFSEYITAEIPPNDGQSGRADRLILRRLRSNRISHDARLVTDDRELARLAAECGITIESCVAFLAKIKSPGTSNRSRMEDEKERAARAIDNTEFLKLWSGPDGREQAREKPDR